MFEVLYPVRHALQRPPQALDVQHQPPFVSQLQLPLLPDLDGYPLPPPLPPPPLLELL